MKTYIRRIITARFKNGTHYLERIVNSLRFMYNYEEIPQITTLPNDDMFCEWPASYRNPSQSRYHNLGLNAFTPVTENYFGKPKGMLGDYGPSQAGCYDRLKSGPYPLDKAVFEQRNMEYKRKCIYCSSTDVFNLTNMPPVLLYCNNCRKITKLN